MAPSGKDIAPKQLTQVKSKTDVKKLMKKDSKHEIKQESVKDSASKRSAKASQKAKPKSNFIQPGQKHCLPLGIPNFMGGFGMPFNNGMMMAGNMFNA